MNRAMNESTFKDDAQHRLAVFSSAGEPCPGCRQLLPIRAKRPNENFAHWECAACHSPLTGVLVHDITPKMAESIQIAQVHFEARDVTPLPESMRELLNEFARMRGRCHADDERPAHARIPQQLDVMVVPVGESWTPRGKPLLGTVVELTPHGLGMVTTSLGGVGHVALQVGTSKGRLQLLGRIACAKDLGQGFQDSGVQFLLRFGPTPVVADTRRPKSQRTGDVTTH
jgi:hypothetical protein